MDIQYLKGVGPKRAQKLKRLDIETIEDLLYYGPRDYDDRTEFKTLLECQHGDKASFEIEILEKGTILRPRKNLSILKVPFKDSSYQGYLTWFNQNYLKDQFKPGDKYIVNGKITKIGMEIQISNPVFEKPGSSNKIGKIIPIYGLTYGLTNNEMIKILSSALSQGLNNLTEILPKTILTKYKMLSIKDAITNIHFPQTRDLQKRARNRLAYQELLILQIGLFLIKNKSYENKEGIDFDKVKEIDGLIKSLPFKLTGAQANVFKEISQDMENKKQMSRLVQGDVGSGKTIIGGLAMFKAIKSGYQSVMMAPTEILANQHFESLNGLFKDFDIKLGLLTGSLPLKKRKEVLKKLEEGEIDLVVGTHALIQDHVKFKKLGLVITDEQHRFGVNQRTILTEKGLNPDVLVMTATPIPRSLALILYGDLDISIIDELPPGRKEIETYALGPEMLDRANEFIRKQVKEGRQAYIVSPLIEESDSLNVKAAEEIYINYKENIFKEFNVGLLHGKMKAKEKEEIMNDFKNNIIQILISTTVIEVGVNVPNSNIMLIYNAERFGLAQLHQLRGRVGRGEYQSYCILINEGKNSIARERMRIMQATSDGFKISEKDLELRGPGEFFGTKQHGLPELRIANLFTDIDILKLAQKDANEILSLDPNLTLEENANIKKKISAVFSKLGENIIFN